MTQQEYDQQKRECWEEFMTRPHENPQSLRRCFDFSLATKIQAELVIRFLLRRFCLVEKEKVREAYKDAQKDQHNSERDFALTLAGRNRSAVLIDLFPGIGKEVEE